MNEVLKHPERLEVSKLRKSKKELRAMCEPGKYVFQEMLGYVSRLFGEMVLVVFVFLSSFLDTYNRRTRKS